MKDLRIVERKDGDVWTQIRMSDLCVGDVFQMTESTGELVGVFEATGTPYVYKGTNAVVGCEVEGVE